MQAPHQSSHQSIEPSILYFGTPVVLVSTVNADGSFNIAPISSVFWLGWRAVIGLGAGGKTVENLIRTGECVLNLPSDREVAAVDRLARLTGSNPVPAAKRLRGYTYERNKFEVAGLTPQPSETVAAPRALQCPVQLEAVVAARHNLMQDDADWDGKLLSFELRIQRVHARADVLMAGHQHRIDPDLWRPLIMSFQKFYALAPGQVHASRLGEIAESSYRTPDVDRAREAAPGAALARTG